MPTDHRGPLIGARDSLRVIDCRLCGWAHLDRVPSTATDAAYYAGEFWQQKKAGALERLRQQAPWWAAIHADWLGVLEHWALQRRLLDVGAGYGQFAGMALSRGWAVDVIEPSLDAQAVLVDERLSLLAPAWEDVRAGQWDAISALWLLEHLADPERFLRWARARVYTGGAMLLVVPHDFSDAQAQAVAAGARPCWWLDETHYSYFNWCSLGNLLGRTGWRIVDRLTLAQMEAFAPLVDYTRAPELGPALHDAAAAADLLMTPDARLTKYRALARVGRGREIVAICVPC